MPGKNCGRTVIEVHHHVHHEIRKLALLNDLRISQLTDAILEDALSQPENIQTLIAKLKRQK